MMQLSRRLRSIFRNRVQGKVIWLLLRPRVELPKLVRLGTRYGGWWIPERVLNSGGVAYCAGVGEDASFDRSLADRGLEVWSFDPTPRSVSYIESKGEGLNFEAVGWWDREGEEKFYAPAESSHVSHSIDNPGGSTDFFQAKVSPVREIQSRLGHQFLDLVKMDIEGAERVVVPDMLKRGPFPSVLCVEIDYPFTTRRLWLFVKQVCSAGFVLCKVEQRNYTFVQRSWLSL